MYIICLNNFARNITIHVKPTEKIYHHEIVCPNASLLLLFVGTRVTYFYILTKKYSYFALKRSLVSTNDSHLMLYLQISNESTFLYVK